MITDKGDCELRKQTECSTFGGFAFFCSILIYLLLKIEIWGVGWFLAIGILTGRYTGVVEEALQV